MQLVSTAENNNLTKQKQNVHKNTKWIPINPSKNDENVLNPML